MVIAKSFDEMLDNLHMIFVRILNANLKLNKRKCIETDAYGSGWGCLKKKKKKKKIIRCTLIANLTAANSKEH